MTLQILYNMKQKHLCGKSGLSHRIGISHVFSPDGRATPEKPFGLSGLMGRTPHKKERKRGCREINSSK